MRITDQTLDKALELSLENLRKNLEPGERNAEIGKAEVLMKTREALKSGKIDLTIAGNIEGRINKNIPLSKAHRISLGLVDSTKIEGLKEPAASNVAARMGGGKTPGGSAARISTGAVAPDVNPIVSAMKAKGKMNHSFQKPDGTVNIVSGAEILGKCAELVKSNRMTLMRAGDVERMVNSGLPIRPEILREIFAT